MVFTIIFAIVLILAVIFGKIFFDKKEFSISAFFVGIIIFSLYQLIVGIFSLV